MLATVASTPTFSDLLRSVRVTDAQTAGGLHVFGCDTKLSLLLSCTLVE